MALIFYYSPMSSATRVHWALEELGIPYEKVKIDLKSGDQRKPAFLKINPNGKVPTLVEDGVPLFESVAILIHLGDKYGAAKKLWPAPNAPERLGALAWTTWSSVTAGAHVFRVLQNTSERFPAEQRNAASAEAARKDVDGCLRILEAELESRPYLLGNSFTLADLANAAMLQFARMVGLDFSAYPKVSDWMQRCTARPALATAAAG